jgi:hypothetical protein
MSLPSCFSQLNPAFFENLIPSINTCATQAELQVLANQIMAEISLLESTLTSQVAFLEPIQALLTAPGANVTALATWIENFITGFLTPYFKPYLIMAAQLTALAAEVTTLVSAIEAAAENIGVEIVIPPITIGCTL